MPTSPAGATGGLPRARRSSGEERAVADLRPGQLRGGAPEDRAGDRSFHGGACWQDSSTGGDPVAPDCAHAGDRRAQAVGRGDRRAAARAARTSPTSSPPAPIRRSRAGRASRRPTRARTPSGSSRSPRPRRPPGEGVALAVADAGGRLIGTVGLMEVDRERGYGELGYWTAAPARGRGAASRAVALLRDWAHAELGLCRARDPLPSRQPPVAARGRAGGLRRHGRDPRGAAHAARQARRLQGLRLAGGLTCGARAAERRRPAAAAPAAARQARGVRAARARARSCWQRPARSRSSRRASPTGRSARCRPRSPSRSRAARPSGCGCPGRPPRSRSSTRTRCRSPSRSRCATRVPSCGSSAPEPTEGLDSAFVLDLGAATDLRGDLARIEALGIESGRLGSERGL